MRRRFKYIYIIQISLQHLNEYQRKRFNCFETFHSAITTPVPRNDHGAIWLINCFHDSILTTYCVPNQFEQFITVTSGRSYFHLPTYLIPTTISSRVTIPNCLAKLSRYVFLTFIQLSRSFKLGERRHPENRNLKRQSSARSGPT